MSENNNDSSSDVGGPEETSPRAEAVFQMAHDEGHLDHEYPTHKFAYFLDELPQPDQSANVILPTTDVLVGISFYSPARRWYYFFEGEMELVRKDGIEFHRPTEEITVDKMWCESDLNHSDDYYDPETYLIKAEGVTLEEYLLKDR